MSVSFEEIRLERALLRANEKWAYVVCDGAHEASRIAAIAVEL